MRNAFFFRFLLFDLNDQSTQGSKKQVAEGVASIVYRAQRKLKDESAWVAIKSSSVRRRYCPEPHDIVKEAAVLESISHHNVTNFIAPYDDTAIR